MKSDVVCTMFALCLYHVCTYFGLCLHPLLTSFDVKMGKIAKEGNRQQALGTSGEKSEVRGRGSGVGEGKRADQFGGGRRVRKVRKVGKVGRKDGGVGGGGDREKK